MRVRAGRGGAQLIDARRIGEEGLARERASGGRLASLPHSAVEASGKDAYAPDSFDDSPKTLRLM